MSKLDQLTIWDSQDAKKVTVVGKIHTNIIEFDKRRSAYKQDIEVYRFETLS